MTISVITAAYNAERFLSLAIESVLNQTFGDFELIIVNDGSTDSSIEIIERYRKADQRVRVIEQSNSGIAASLNRGIAAARHELVAIMDADDIMMPMRLERQFSFLNSRSNLAVACSHAALIDIAGRQIGTSRHSVDVERGRREANPRLFSEIVHPTVLMRKQAVLQAGGYRSGIAFKAAPDRDLWGRVVAAGFDIQCQPEILLRYRLHLGAISAERMRQNAQFAAYIDANATRRLLGHPELSVECYLATLKQRPLLERLNERRKDSALLHFKRATRYRGERMFLNCVGSLALATSLDPGHVAWRLWTKAALSLKDRTSSDPIR